MSVFPGKTIFPESSVTSKFIFFEAVSISLMKRTPQTIMFTLAKCVYLYLFHVSVTEIMVIPEGFALQHLHQMEKKHFKTYFKPPYGLYIVYQRLNVKRFRKI